MFYSSTAPCAYFRRQIFVSSTANYFPPTTLSFSAKSWARKRRTIPLFGRKFVGLGISACLLCMRAVNFHLPRLCWARAGVNLGVCVRVCVRHWYREQQQQQQGHKLRASSDAAIKIVYTNLKLTFIGDFFARGEGKKRENA